MIIVLEDDKNTPEKSKAVRVVLGYDSVAARDREWLG